MVFPRQNLTKWDAVFCKKHILNMFCESWKKLKSISTFKAPKIDFLWRVVDFPGLGFTLAEPQTGIIENPDLGFCLSLCKMSNLAPWGL